MKPKEVYQAVHDRWSLFAAGDFSQGATGHCAFCGLGTGCDHCPAYHALGTECLNHPALERFYRVFYEVSEEVSAAYAKDVLDLLEQNEDAIIGYMEGRR